MYDKDLQAIQQVRDLMARAKKAQEKLREFNQHRIDKVVETMCKRGARYAKELADLAHQETKMGRADSKYTKNWVNTEYLWDYIKDVKTVGVINRDEEKKILEVAVPKGIVAAIIPTTNPTSTTLFKAIISIKARNPVVFSPHPRATECIARTAKVMHQAAVDAGAPEGCIGCMEIPTLEATHALMKHKDTGIILATGGGGLVKAAYSSGKPALGVGPGNAPAYIHRSANAKHAVSAIVMSQTFDWGTICSTENSIVCDRIIAPEVLRELVRQKAHICNPEEQKLLSDLYRGPTGGLNTEVVGQSPYRLAEMSGFRVPEDTTVLIAQLDKIGKAYPLSKEKLSPTLAFYIAEDVDHGLSLCDELLNAGGTGHTLGLHGQDEEVLVYLAERLPAYRIVVNSPTVHGSIGYATHLIPSMSLGCGTPGNNITSDNINAHNLIDIKRVAWVKDGFVKIPEGHGRVWSDQGDSLGNISSAPSANPHTPTPGAQPGRGPAPSSPVVGSPPTSGSSSSSSVSPLTESDIEAILKRAGVNKGGGGY